MSRHRSVAQDLSLLCTFDVWLPVPSLSLARIHTHAHSISRSLLACLCAPLSFSPCLSLWTVCTPGCTSAFVLPACRFALSLRLTPFPSSASLNAQRPAHPVSLSAAGLSLSRTLNRGLCLSLLGCLLLSLCLFSSLRTFSPGSCARGPLALSPRAPAGQQRTFSPGSRARGPLALSPRAPAGQQRTFLMHLTR